MSAPINTGGPAFPVNSPVDDTGRVAVGYPYPCEGMTLRDYFAAKELAKTSGTAICHGPEVYARLADHCYRMADAMLAAREARTSEERYVEGLQR